jgi:UDP-glucose:glycoprotein glucosyltransferase
MYVLLTSRFFITDSKMFSDLGVQAAQLILSSSEPLKALEHLSSNFPRYATQLARSLEIDGDLQYEMAYIAKKLPKGTDMNMLWINGKVLDGTVGEVFSPLG